MADQPENKPAPEVVEGTGETKVEAPSAAHTEVYDRSSPTPTTLAKTGELSQEVKNILGRFAIIGDDASRAGTDGRWALGLFGEQHRGFGAFGDTMRDVTRTPDGKYIGRDGKPLSTGEMNVTFRHLVQGALKTGESPQSVAQALDKSLEGSGFRVQYDSEKGSIKLVDTKNPNADGTDRELSRFKPNESPQEHAERMADRFSDMSPQQQEAFIKRGISTMLRGMTDIPGGQTADQQRKAFIDNFNNQLRASGNADQTLEFDPKNGAVIRSDVPGRAIEGAATPEVPEGLRLQGKQNLESQYRNLSNFIQNAETNGKTVSDIQAELKKVTGASTGDLNNMAAGLNLDVKEQYGPEFGVRRNDKNQLEMTVRVSDTPPVDMPIPTGMNAEQARSWAKTVKAIQTEAANPGGLKAAMEGDLGRQVHQQLSALSPEMRKTMLDSINRALPENDHKLGLSPTDNQSIDLITRDGSREAQFPSPETEAKRAEIWNNRPTKLSEQSKDAYIDSVMKLTTGGAEGRGDAVRALRDTVRGLPSEQQKEFLDGVNAELRAAGKDFRITNTDGRIEARTTIVVNDKDVPVPRYLEGNPAQVEAFRDLAQRVANGEDLTQLTKGANDLTSNLGFYGRQEVLNSLNGLLPEGSKNLKFAEGRSGVELQVNIGNDTQGNPRWRSVPEGMSLSDAGQIGKTIPAGLDNAASERYKALLDTLGQNPNEIFNKERMDQIKRDLSRLEPDQANLYRDQINAQLGDKFQLGQNGDVRTKPGDVPVPEGLNAQEADTFRGLAERAITDIKGSELGSDLLKALNSVRPEVKQAFLDGINNAYGPKHNSENFSISGDNLNLNKWKLGIDPFTNPVLDTFKPAGDQSNFENLLRTNGFENPGANPKVEAIRQSFDKLKADPSDAQAMKDLLTSLKGANFTQQQIDAIQKAFQADKPENPALRIGNDGVIQVGDTTLIKTSTGVFMSVKGNLSPDAAQNLKYAAEQIDPQNPISAFTAKNISEVLKSVTDPTVRDNIVKSFNSFLESVRSQDQIAAHPNGDGIYIKRTDAGNVETNRWVKHTGVEAKPEELAADSMARLVQNPTDGKTLVEALERDRQALTQEVERMLGSGEPPYSPEIESKIQALYQNGNESTKKLIERSLAVVGDFGLASKLGMPENALKVVEFSRDIKANGLDSVGTKLSEFLSHLTPQARNEVMADLRDAVVKSSGQGHELAFNDKNELVLKKGNTVVDGYPNGALGEVLDKMRAHGIADPYVISNLAKISDAFTQIKANDPAGLKAFLEQLSVAKLDAATQAKLVAGLNEHFHTNVSMNEQGVLTDGTNSFRLAEVNGKAMAIPASLSADLVAKLSNKEQLKDALTSLARSGDLTQLRALLQAGNGDFKDVVAQALTDSGRTDTAALARELGLSSDVIAAAETRDKQLTFQNELKALLPNTSPAAVVQLAQQFEKFKLAIAAGNGAAALTEFAAAAKGNLSAALIDKLNTQLSGFQLAYGTGTLALARIGGDSLTPYIASVDTSDATAIPVGFMAAHAAEGQPKPDAYKAGEVYRVGQLASEANPPILEMPKTPALPDRVMSQLYGLAIETRLELQVALRGKTDPAERARIVQDILVKKGLDVMGHATTSENGMTIEQRQAFVEAMNKFLLSAASVDGFAPALKDFRFKLSGDATNASLSLEGDGKSIPLTTAESRDRLYEQRLGDALGLDVTKHAELKTSLRALREATTPEARETAYKALLAKMTSLNLTADQMKRMVETLQDPKFKFIEGTGTISYDGPPNLNLKHFKTWGENFYAPGDMTNKQYLQFSGLMTGFAGDGNIGNFRVNLGSFRQLLASLRPDQREAVVREAQRALNKWKPEVKLAIDGGNLIVDGITSERVWSITNDAANDLRPTVEKFEVGGKQYDLPPNLTDAQKEQLKGVITELGKPPAGTITQAVREQLAAILKDVPLGTARTEMLRTINAASTELQKTTFTLEGNKLSIVTDGKPVTPPIDIPAPTAGPADLASAMKELQALINCNVNPDTGLMRKAISDVARLFAKEKGSNFDPAELARMLNSAGMNNFKFTLDTTSKPGQTEIVVTDKAGKEINRINTRDIVSDATVAAGPVGPAASSERTDIPDLSQVPEAQRPLVAAIFKANDVQSMLKAISEARKANLTQFKIGNDVYRIDVKGLGANTSLVHMTINGKIAVKAVDRNGVYHPQSDGKFFGSSYLKSNPDSPIATRARDLKLSTPQEVSTAIQAGALTPGRTTDGPLSPQQVQDRLKELGVTIPDTIKAQTAFKQIQDLQNAIRTSNPADIRKALDVLKGNTDLGPQFDGLIAKINENPANALKIEAGAIKLQIGTQKYDIPPTWDANTIRNLVRLSTTDAKVAANLYRYINDAQSAVADKGAIMRNLLNSGLDSKQQAALIMEAFKHESGRNPNYTIQKFVEDLKVIPNAGKPEEPVFEFKGGAFVISDKSGTVRASIPETDIKAAVAAQQLRNMFDGSLPGTDPKKADFNPELLPKASKIAEVLRNLTPAERIKAIADLKADLQAKGIRLDITNPNTTSPRVEMTYENPATKQQVRDSAAIGDAAAPTVPTERDAIAFGDAMKQLLARNPKPTQKDVEDLLKSWTDKINTPGLDRNAFINRIKQQLGPNNNLEIVGTGTDAKLVFKGKNAQGETIEAAVALGAPREVATATGPRTDVPALTDITGIPADKAPLVQAIYQANDVQSMLRAIKAAQTAGIKNFKIGNDSISLQSINVGKGTALVHMTINGKIAVKAVDRNGTFTPQMDGKFFGSNHGNALINARAEQWKLRTPQEVSTTLRAGTVPGDTTLGTTAPVEAPLTPQVVKERLAALGVTNITDDNNAQKAYKQIQDLQAALRSVNPEEVRKALTALKANGDLTASMAGLITKVNEGSGVLKIEGDKLSLQVADKKLLIPDTWDAATVRNLVRLASSNDAGDKTTAANLYNFLTLGQGDPAKEVAALSTLLSANKDFAQSQKLLMEIFKRESALKPGLTLAQFNEKFKAAAPEGYQFDIRSGSLVLFEKASGNVRINVTESAAKVELATQSLRNLIDFSTPGIDPKKPGFNSNLIPKAEKIAEILKNLNPDERAQAVKELTAALGERNIRLALTGTTTSPMVEVSFDTSRGRVIDAKRIGDATTPAVSSEQTALGMAETLKNLLAQKTPPADETQILNQIKTMADQLKTLSGDRAALVALMQQKLDTLTPKPKLELSGTGADTTLVLKRESKPDVSAVVGAASAPDKATASIVDLAVSRGIDPAKIPAEGTPQRRLFEAMLRGADGKTLTLLIKELHGKGLRSVELPDANGKMRKMELQVSGHYVHLYAADDSGRMRIAIRGTTDGRPQRGGYFGTRWTESMLGKSIIGTNKDATTPTPEVTNPAVSAARVNEYKPNPEAMKAFTDLLTTTPPADRDKPDFQAKLAQAFSEAVRAELVAKGKDKAAEIKTGLEAALASKGYKVNFEATTGKFTLTKDGSATALTEVSVANVPDKGQAETADQRAARLLEPFGAMNREQRKAYLTRIAADIGSLGLIEGRNVFNALQSGLRKLASADVRLKDMHLSLKNNNEIVLEKMTPASGKTEPRPEYSDSAPVTFKTSVAPGDVQAFASRMQELVRAGDGKPSNAAVEEFKQFIQSLPASANRNALAAAALRRAIFAHVALNDATAAKIIESFDPVLKSVNPAWGISEGPSPQRDLVITGLDKQPLVLSRASIVEAKADLVNARKLLPLANELSRATSLGGREFSSQFGEFAKANADKPELVRAALKMALREQMRLNPGQNMQTLLTDYNGRMRNLGLPYSIALDTLTGALSMKNGTADVPGQIHPREYMASEKFTAFVSETPGIFANAIEKSTTPEETAALLERLKTYLISNGFAPPQMLQALRAINSKLTKVAVVYESGKLVTKPRTTAA